MQSGALMFVAFEGCRSDINWLRWEDFSFFLMKQDKNQ